MDNDESPKRVGRPTKKSLKANSPGGRPARGRPKGDAAILNEYKARMLASPKSRKVLDKVFEIALNDEHKNQAVCLKLVMDRVVPSSAFEAEIKRSGGTNGVTININGIGAVQEEETVDAEFIDITQEETET